MKIRMTIAALVVAAGASSAWAQSFSEGFDSVLPANWIRSNQSDNPGTLSWRQGGTAAGGIWDSQSGAANSYAMTAWNSIASGAGVISDWLITPMLTGIQNGDTFSFYTRTFDVVSFPDRMQVRLSTNGSRDPGLGSASVGDFGTLLLDINPNYLASGAGSYPNGWTQFTITVSGLGGPVNGAFAFRYFVEDGGPSGNNSDRVGVDTVVYTSVPTPGALAGLGLVGLAGLRRRR